MRQSVSKTIAAQNIFSDALVVDAGTRISLSIQPGSATTVTLQRRLDGTNWRDVQSWTAAVEATCVADEGGEYRLGVKTGNYGASTTVRLGVG